MDRAPEYPGPGKHAAAAEGAANKHLPIVDQATLRTAESRGGARAAHAVLESQLKEQTEVAASNQIRRLVVDDAQDRRRLPSPEIVRANRHQLLEKESAIYSKLVFCHHSCHIFER